MRKLPSPLFASSSLSNQQAHSEPHFELFNLEPFDSDLKSSLHESVEFGNSAAR